MQQNTDLVLFCYITTRNKNYCCGVMWSMMNNEHDITFALFQHNILFKLISPFLNAWVLPVIVSIRQLSYLSVTLLPVLQME